MPLTAASDGGPIGDEGSRVVEQGLALDERPDDPRRAEPAEDRRGRQGVGRADDRSERERGRPAESGIAACATTATITIVKMHEADREPDERGDVRPQVADRRLGGRAEQQRRQEDEQDQVRLELRCGAGPGTNASPRPPRTSSVG